jgi:hypothetical protein
MCACVTCCPFIQMQTGDCHGSVAMPAEFPRNRPIAHTSKRARVKRGREGSRCANACVCMQAYRECACGTSVNTSRRLKRAAQRLCLSCDVTSINVQMKTRSKRINHQNARPKLAHPSVQTSPRPHHVRKKRNHQRPSSAPDHALPAGRTTANWDVIEVPTSHPSEDGGVHPSAWTKHRPRGSPTRSSHVIACMHTRIIAARQPTRSGDAVVNAVERASQAAAGAVIINMHACYPFTSCATSASAEKVTPHPFRGQRALGGGHRCDRPQPHCPCQQTWPTE